MGRTPKYSKEEKIKHVKIIAAKRGAMPTLQKALEHMVKLCVSSICYM